MIEKFLNALFGEIPEDSYFYIWDKGKDSKLTLWYRGPAGIPKAIKYANNRKDHRDIYISCGLSKKALGPTRRTPATDISGIVGTWVDIDIAGGEHKKQNLPQTQDEALGLLDSCGLAPTITIHSGHGLQAWWLFNEPWIFESEEQRDYASQFTASWIYSIRHRARERGWDVDATIDLSRVLRLPGTTNRKNLRDIKDVKILNFEPGNRYEPDDMEEYILEDAWKAVQNGESVVKGSTYVADFELNPEAEPSMKKWRALVANDKKFEQSWNHKRKDLQDQSQSSYDLSLASIAVRAGWTDQEVVNLLIANRAEHNQDLKLRPDYYARTIARAKSGMQQTDDDDDTDWDSVGKTLETISKIKEDSQLSSGEKDLLTLECISTAMQVEILKVVKYIGDPPQLRIYTREGDIYFKDAGDLLNLNIVRRGVLNTCSKVVPSMKRAEWDSVAQQIISLAVEEELDESMTEFGNMSARLEAYLRAKFPESDENKFDRAFITNRPIIKNNRILISLSDDFVLWYQSQTKDKVSDRHIGATLKAMGAESTRLPVTVEGKRTTKSRWILPGEPEKWGVFLDS